MKRADLIRLLLLAAIWGASFLFIRVAAPAFGSSALMCVRVVIAALFLFAVMQLFGKNRLQSSDVWHYILLGGVNSALPFVLYAYASHWLSASILAVLNATAPMWGLLIGVLVFKQQVPLKSLLGLALGVVGVAVLVGFDPLLLQPGSGLAVAAGAAAACCYGIATHYTKRAKPRQAFDNAHGSMWAAAIWLAPFAMMNWPETMPGTEMWLAVSILAVVCTSIAYLLYFRLLSDIGPTNSLTVTFLIPVFGVFWGHTLLDEVIGWHTVLGVVCVLSGTSLVTGFSLKNLWQQKGENLAK
jgi:drug/metabolite transporter (DMT)-like permease